MHPLARHTVGQSRSGSAWNSDARGASGTGSGQPRAHCVSPRVPRSQAYRCFRELPGAICPRTAKCKPLFALMQPGGSSRARRCRRLAAAGAGWANFGTQHPTPLSARGRSCSTRRRETIKHNAIFMTLEPLVEFVRPADADTMSAAGCKRGQNKEESDAISKRCQISRARTVRP